MKYHHILRKYFREKSVVVAMCLSVVLLFFTSFLLDSFQAQKQYQRQMIYGFHNGAAFDISEREENKIQNHLSIKVSGEMIVYGTIIGDDSSEIGNIGTVDQNFWNLEQFQLIDGTFPTKENEVVMEYAMLDLLHLPYEIGENIDLKIQVTDGTLIEKSYVYQESFKHIQRIGCAMIILCFLLLQNNVIVNQCNDIFSFPLHIRMRMK